MKKIDMAVDILSALLNIPLEKANRLAENGHGEFKHLMQFKRKYLMEMHEKSLDSLH